MDIVLAISATVTLLVIWWAIRLNRMLDDDEIHELMGDDQYAIDHDMVNEGYPIERE